MFSRSSEYRCWSSGDRPLLIPWARGDDDLPESGTQFLIEVCYAGRLYILDTTKLLMGLFGRDEPTERVQSLVEEAKHNSVTAEVIGKRKASGIGSRDYLNDEPLIEHLQEEEQPHFVFPLVTAGDSGVFVDAGDDLLPNGKFRTIVAVTDQRVLIVVGDKTGDKEASITYPEITAIELNDEDVGRHTLYDMTIVTKAETYHIREFTSEDRGEETNTKFREAGQYISGLTD